MMKYIVIDIDGVIRDIESELLKNSDLVDPGSQEDLRALYSTLTNLSWKETYKVYRDSNVIHGSKSILEQMDMLGTPENKVQVHIVSASGFSYKSLEGTLEFLRINGLKKSAIVTLTDGTGSKLKHINSLAKDLGPDDDMLIIDDWSHILENSPASARKIWIKQNRLWTDTFHPPDDWVVVESIADIELSML